MYRFLIADDHAVVRRGVKQILLDDFPTAFVGEATDAENMLKKLLKSTWNVLISDVSMPGRSGLDVMQEIRRDHPKLPVLFLSVSPESQYAVRLFRAGAYGYLTKDSASEDLIKAIRHLLLGKKYVTPSLAELLGATFDHDLDKAPHENLSNREFEVMMELAAGRSVSNIADKISLSVTSVSTCRARVMAKMKLKTNADLTFYGVEHKII